MSSASWFSRAILPWYRENARPLPWRATRDPYRIWLSEVILQQTRVDQGSAYWHRFVERYPTVEQLAAAPEDAVLRLWQGLGYYTRARNLLLAARQVVDQHAGCFPDDFDALKELKGIGDYTAAAIASIAFNRPEPVVDGNVYRVLSRVFGISTPIDSTLGRREFRELAGVLIDREAPGDHNQAVMELGAMVCKPVAPDCGTCPLTSRCVARSSGHISELPVKVGRTAVRERHFNYLYIPVDGGFYLRKRVERDIWQGLYELPLLETLRPASEKRLQKDLEKLGGGGLCLKQRSQEVIHLLTHQRIKTVFWKVEARSDHRPPDDWLLVRFDALDHHALPRPIERYLGTMATAKMR